MPIVVQIAGRETPVVLESRGPELSELEVANFERQLGVSLPPDYREFLLSYNGGTPVVGAVCGRDDDPSTPYRYGDSVNTFLKLRGSTGELSDWERLRAPREIPWALPANILPVAEDGGGNCFYLDLGDPAGCIRFLDHEALDEPISRHRVIAESFLDLLLRFRSVEEQTAIDKARLDAAREATGSGAFPVWLETQCRMVEASVPEIRDWIRALSLKIFDAKGHFSVHDDDLSRMLLDLAFWLNQQAQSLEGPIERGQIFTVATKWHQEGEGGFGFSGYAPDFLYGWWRDRLAKGMLRGDYESARFTEEASAELLRTLREMSKSK